MRELEKIQRSPFRSCLNGVYARVAGKLVASDTHQGLRILALRRCQSLGLPYTAAGSEIYPASLGRMLDHGPVYMQALWRDIGQQGQSVLRLPGAVVAIAIRREIALRSNPNDQRNIKLLGRSADMIPWVALADECADRELTVTLTMGSTGLSIAVQLDADWAGRHTHLWQGRLPDWTCREWLDGLITDYLAAQPELAESAEAHASYERELEAIRKEHMAESTRWSRAKQLRESGALTPHAGIALHGWGLGHPKCDYDIVTPKPTDQVYSVNVADEPEYLDKNSRSAMLRLARRLGADFSRNVIIILRGEGGNGCRYDAMVYLAASHDDWLRTPGINGCTRYGLRKDYGF